MVTVREYHKYLTCRTLSSESVSFSKEDDIDSDNLKALASLLVSSVCLTSGIFGLDGTWVLEGGLKEWDEFVGWWWGGGDGREGRMGRGWEGEEVGFPVHKDKCCDIVSY